MKSFQHDNIERSCSRIWKLDFLKQVMTQCKEAEFDVEFINTEDEGHIVIGLVDTDQIFLKALRRSNNHKSNGDWLVRYDQKLFDENYKG